MALLMIWQEIEKKSLPLLRWYSRECVTISCDPEEQLNILPRVHKQSLAPLLSSDCLCLLWTPEAECLGVEGSFFTLCSGVRRFRPPVRLSQRPGRGRFLDPLGNPFHILLGFLSAVTEVRNSELP